MDTLDQVDHRGMDHSKHIDSAADMSESSQDACSCCDDGCANHCAGGSAFIRLAQLRSAAWRFDVFTGPAFAPAQLPSPPVFGLFRPPIVS